MLGSWSGSPSRHEMRVCSASSIWEPVPVRTLGGSEERGGGPQTGPTTRRVHGSLGGGGSQAQASVSPRGELGVSVHQIRGPWMEAGGGAAGLWEALEGLRARHGAHRAREGGGGGVLAGGGLRGWAQAPGTCGVHPTVPSGRGVSLPGPGWAWGSSGPCGNPPRWLPAPVHGAETFRNGKQKLPPRPQTC